MKLLFYARIKSVVLNRYEPFFGLAGEMHYARIRTGMSPGTVPTKTPASTLSRIVGGDRIARLQPPRQSEPTAVKLLPNKQ